MWGSLILGLLALTVLSIVGLVVVSLTRIPGASDHAIAAPIIGVVAISLSQAVIGAILPTRVGSVVLIVVLVVGVVRVTRSRRSEFAGAVSKFRATPLLLIMGIPALFVGGAVFDDEPAFVRTGQTFDVYAYVASADWMDNHRYTDMPDPAEDSPGDLYARGHLGADLRVGNEQTITTLAFTLGGIDEMRFMQAVQGVWMTLLALGSGSLALALNTGLRRAVIVALIVPLSPLVLAQFTDQNVASLLGIAVGLTAVGAVNTTLLKPNHGNGVIAGFFLTGIAAVYTELLILILPTVAILFLVKVAAKASRMDAWRWFGGIAVSALALGIIPWYRALISLSGHASQGRDIPGYLSPFDPAHSDIGTVAARIAGEYGYFEGSGLSGAGVALVGLLLVGILVALFTQTSRGVGLSLVLSWVGVVFLLTAQSNLQYPQFRAIQFTSTFLLAIAVIGLTQLSSSLGRFPVREGVLLAIPLAVVALWAPGLLSLNKRANDLRTSVPLDEVAQAESWIEDFAAHNVLIVESEFGQQLALIHNLKDRPEVAYAGLEPSYVGMPSDSHWDGVMRPYVLIGRSELRSPDDATPIKSNALFELYRTADLDQSILAFTVMDATAGGVAIAAAQTGDLYYIYPLDFNRTDDAEAYMISATCGVVPGWVRLEGDQLTADVPGVTLSAIENSRRPKYSLALDLSACGFPRVEFGVPN